MIPINNRPPILNAAWCAFFNPGDAKKCEDDHQVTSSAHKGVTKVSILLRLLFTLSIILLYDTVHQPKDMRMYHLHFDT